MNTNVFLYFIALILGGVSGALAVNAYKLAIVLCAIAILLVLLVLGARLAERKRNRYKEYLFDFEAFCKEYLDLSYNNLSELLIKKGGFNYEAPDPGEKSVELALLNRLAFLKFLEEN